MSVHPFGRQTRGERYQIRCLGCPREFASLADYRAHNCPNPESGEAFI